MVEEAAPGLERQPHQDVDARGGRSLAWALVVVVAAERPLRLWAANFYLGVSVRELALYAGVVLAIAVLLSCLGRLLGMNRIGAAFLGSLMTLFIVNWDGIYAILSLWGLLLVGLGAMAVQRLDKSGLLAPAALIVVAVLGLAPAIQLGMATTQGGSSNVIAYQPLAESAGSGVVENVLLVVLDQYTSRGVLEEDYGHDSAEMVDHLESIGFTVPMSGVSTATTTYVSVAEMLELGPVFPDAVVASPADYRALYGVMGGHNRLVGSLRAAGFTYTHIESGWEGTRCGERVDSCVAAPWPNDTAWSLWRPTAIGGLMDRTVRHPYIYASLEAVRELEDVLGRIENNGQRDFVFAHILIPHGPFILDSDCSLRTGSGDGLVGDERRARYIAQVGCAERIVRMVSEAAGDSTGILITSDHGDPENRSESPEPAEWSDRTLAQRLAAFMTYRLPAQCEEPSDSVTVAIVAAILECAVDGALAVVPTFTGVVNDLPGVAPHHVYRIPDERMTRIRSVYD